MAELVDAPDLGSGVMRRVGSSPIRRTEEKDREYGLHHTHGLAFFDTKLTMMSFTTDDTSITGSVKKHPCHPLWKSSHCHITLHTKATAACGMYTA